MAGQIFLDGGGNCGRGFMATIMRAEFSSLSMALTSVPASTRSSNRSKSLCSLAIRKAVLPDVFRHSKNVCNEMMDDLDLTQLTNNSAI